MTGAEKRIRAAEERTRQRIEAASKRHLSPPTERGTWAEFRERLDGLREEIGGHFGETGDFPSGASGPLDRIFLERALSALKHGLVESCFYNLRILAQKVSLDGTDDDARALKAASDRLPAVRKELGSFLEGRVPCGMLVAKLLPDLASVFRNTLPALELVVAGGFGLVGEIPPLVDAILFGLSRETDRLRTLRLSLVALVQKALELEKPRLQEADMNVKVVREVDDDRIHADEPRLLATVVELLRNAAIHRKRNGPGEVLIRLTSDENNVSLKISSKPALPPVGPLDRLFEVGCSRRQDGGEGLAAVRRTLAAHGGETKLWFSGGSGTFDVSLSLPTRLPI
jgi:hypothetical protein